MSGEGIPGSFPAENAPCCRPELRSTQTHPPSSPRRYEVARYILGADARYPLFLYPSYALLDGEKGQKFKKFVERAEGIYQVLCRGSDSCQAQQ